MLAPIVEQISTQFKDINFLKVDIDQFSDIAQMFFIQSIPTIYLFKDGKPLNHFVGFKPVTEIIEFIKQNKKSK
jgi:thioredoxin-like negative regulator of GroEL